MLRAAGAADNEVAELRGLLLPSPPRHVAGAVPATRASVASLSAAERDPPFQPWTAQELQARLRDKEREVALLEEHNTLLQRTATDRDRTVTDLERQCADLQSNLAELQAIMQEGPAALDATRFLRLQSEVCLLFHCSLL